jgi:predicted RNA methylase
MPILAVAEALAPPIQGNEVLDLAAGHSGEDV